MEQIQNTALDNSAKTRLIFLPPSSDDSQNDHAEVSMTIIDIPSAPEPSLAGNFHRTN